MLLTSAPRCRSPGYHFPGALLPAKRVSHKVTLILDLDETLVHSSFKPVPGADWVVPILSYPLVAPPFLARSHTRGMLRDLTPVLSCRMVEGAMVAHCQDVRRYGGGWVSSGFRVGAWRQVSRSSYAGALWYD